jgi:hypothetical protein
MLVVVALACMMTFAHGHGFMARPMARNVQHNSHWCPACLTGPEACGDQRGRHDHETGGKFATPPRIAGTFKPGAIVSTTVVITANHQGRWGLELCASPPERASCFKPLRRADGGDRYVYIPSNASSSRGKFRLPRDVRCKHCVLRWRWETGNTCNPAGTPARYRNPYVSTCTPKSPTEHFTNCADIQIL